MLGHDVMRAGGAGRARARAGRPARARHHRRAGGRDAARSAEQAAGSTAIVNCAAWTDVDGAESKPEAARAVNADGAGVLARGGGARRGCRCCTSRPTTSSTASRRSTATGHPRPIWSPTRPARAPSTARPSSRASGWCSRPRRGTRVVRTAWLYGVDGAQLRRPRCCASPASATRCRSSPTRSARPTWSGHLAPALLGLLERGVSGPRPPDRRRRRSPGTASPRRSSARPRSTAASSRRRATQFARPAPRPAWSALESERDDVLPLPPWQDGLAGYLAARAGMMRA